MHVCGSLTERRSTRGDVSSQSYILRLPCIDVVVSDTLPESTLESEQVAAAIRRDVVEYLRALESRGAEGQAELGKALSKLQANAQRAPAVQPMPQTASVAGASTTVSTEHTSEIYVRSSASFLWQSSNMMRQGPESELLLELSTLWKLRAAHETAEEAKSVRVPRAEALAPISEDSTASKRIALLRKVNALIKAHTESAPSTGLNRINRITDGAAGTATGNSRNAQVVAGQHAAQVRTKALYI